MSDSTQHSNPTAMSVNTSTLKYVAEQSMPQVATDLGNQAQNMQQLLVSANNEWGAGPNPAFGSEVPGAASLGSQYNAVLTAISALAAQLGTSIQTGAKSLDTIAVNYHTTESSLAGNQ